MCLSRKKKTSRIFVSYLTTYSVLNVARINVLMFACCESLDKTCEKPFGVWKCGLCPDINCYISELYVPGALRSSHNTRWSYGRTFTKGLTITLSLLAWIIWDYDSETRLWYHYIIVRYDGHVVRWTELAGQQRLWRNLYYLNLRKAEMCLSLWWACMPIVPKMSECEW